MSVPDKVLTNCEEKPMLLTEAFELYRSDVIVFKNQSSKTEENHTVCLRAMLRHFGDVDLRELTFADIRDWKIELDKKRSPSTVRNYIIRLRVVLAFCKARGIECVDVDLIPVPGRIDRVPAFISKEEVTQLIEAVKQEAPGYSKANRCKNAAVISILYASGIRVSELCNLNRGDIKEDNSFTVVGKGGKARLCFMDDRSAAYLKCYHKYREDNDEALFLSNQTRQRITTGSVQEVFRLASKKAGFTTPVHPHTLRHSFATNLLRNNANMRYVQVMLGHSSLETTQMYSHVVDEDLRAAYQKHHTL